MIWILVEVIDGIKSRIQALENVTKDAEVREIYKSAKLDEIKFLQGLLKEIDDMMLEEIKHDAMAEEELRLNRADVYI